MEKKYFIFSIVCNVAHTFVLVEFGQKAEQLFLYTYPHYLFPLKLDIEGYLKEFDKYKGTLLWQEACIDREKCSPENLKELANWRKENSAFIVAKVFNDLHEMKDYSGDFDFVKQGIQQNYYSRLKTNLDNLEVKIKEKGGELKYGHPILKAGIILNIQIIRKIETILGWKLPGEFLAFYSQINGLRIDWTHKGLKINDRYPCSALHILPLEEVFGGSEPYKNRVWHDTMWEGSVTMSNIMPDEILRFTKQCRPIIFSATGDGIGVFIRLNHEKQDLDLYLATDEDYYPLDVSFTGFFNSLIDVAGLNHWVVLNKYNRKMPQYLIKAYDPVKKFMKALFPGVELDDYYDN